MAYTPSTWADGEAGGTPINAAALNKIETGIDAAHTTADGAAPASHTHAVGDVSGLQDALDADVTWAAVTGKPSTFTPATHTHAVGDVSGLQSIIDDLTARIEALEVPEE